MSRSQAPLALLAVASLMTAPLFSPPSWAQETAPVVPPEKAATPEPTPPAPPAPRTPTVLKEVVDEIVWRPEQQGLLLIVAPDKITNQQEPEFTDDGTYIPHETGSLPPKGDGLRVSTLENYFPVVAVRCGSGVTVLAPSKMHVLNYQNLPKPSAYAGFRPADSFRLLQASLTEAQWRQISGPQGLGLGDLDGEQREMFLASLPPTMTVQLVNGDETEKVRVGEPQRRGIRLRMAREMNWSIRTENGGGYGSGRQAGVASRSVVLPEQFNWDKRRRQSFGVELMSKVPAQFKPGQLPFDWEALSVDVDLRDVKTVGDLVKRVGETTRVELYCDPRYARLPVFLRGTGGQAGSLLKAVARGVTGTWRRIENAYLLTDDVTGLAVRHAILADWAGQNSALAAEVDRKVGSSLRKSKPAQYITYAGDDTMKPSEGLLAKYQAHQADLRKPRKQGETPPDWNKGWPVSELPAAAQEEVRKQLKDFDSGRYGFEPNQKPVTDSVNLSFSTVLKWDIPGIGLVPSPYGADVLSIADEQEMMQAQLAEMMKGQPMPSGMKTRALLLHPGKPEANERALRAARRAGFTEVWIDILPGEEKSLDALQSVTKTAQGMNFQFRAVLSALRRAPQKGASNDGADRNLLGETYTQYLDRRLSLGLWPSSGYEYPFGDPKPGAVNPAEVAARRQRERGDWLDPTMSGVETAVAERIKAISKIPGLAGIVLRDLTPPGYDAPLPQNYGPQPTVPDAQGGFSLARRVAFLKKYAVDPLDLSTTGGNLNRAYLRFRENNWTDINLPLFPDYGASAAYRTVDGVSATEQGAGNSLQMWNRFRHADAEAALKRIEAKVRSTAGKLPVWYYHNQSDTQPFFASVPRVESRDKADPTPTAKPGESEAPKPPMEMNPFTPSKAAREKSTTLLYALDVAGMLASAGVGLPFEPPQYLLLMTGYLFDPKNAQLKDWDGVAMDLSGETPGIVSEMLDALPAPKPEAANKKTAVRP